MGNEIKKVINPDEQFLMMFTKKEIIEAVVKTLGIYAICELKSVLFEHKIREIQKQSCEIRNEINAKVMSIDELSEKTDQIIRLDNKCDKLYYMYEKAN